MYHSYVDECRQNNYVWCYFDIDEDLSTKLPENRRDFNAEFIPQWLEKHPWKSKIAAWLACGFTRTICKGMSKWDIVICPDGTGNYSVGEVTSDYFYVWGTPLPHRRKVQWLPIVVNKSAMSEQLRRSIGSIGTVCDVTRYWAEIQELLAWHNQPMIIATHEDIEDPSVFALEKHLEDFLVQNRSNTELGKQYDIYTEEWELVWQQFPSDTWPIDILAISKDKKELLVVELKKWRWSDVVIGQVQRYMWYVKGELAEQWQEVKGVIIALEDDLRLRRALSVTNNISFYRYKVSFQLLPVL